MVCLSDLKELKQFFDPNIAVNVVKHDYKTKHKIKYFDKNEDYPRKNWLVIV